MADTTLKAEPRSSGRHAVRELRDTAKVPAVVYGPGINEPIAVDSRELRKALIHAGTGLIALSIGDREPLQVLAREVQHHPFKRYTQHVDFLAVSMTEVLRVEVPIHLEGSSPALARAGTVLIHNMETVEVECLPTDIPQHLVADLGKLVTIEDSIYARDLVIPANVKLLENPNHVVISITMSRTEAEAEAVSAEAAPTTEVEVVAKGKAKEGEEEVA